MKHVLVLGASSGGTLVSRELARSDKFKLVGFLDNNEGLYGKLINGGKVLGSFDELQTTILDNRIDEVIVAISNIDAESLRFISSVCSSYSLDLRVIPSVFEVIVDDPMLGQLRDIDVMDLLGRDEVDISEEFVEVEIFNSTIVVTGGAGSIGSEIIRQLLKFSPKKIIVVDLNENDLYMLELFAKRHFSKVIFKSVICSVQDKEALSECLIGEKIKLFYHCAAHKHVPLMESVPAQAVKNNVLGTYHAACVAVELDIERFVLISTDKAVNPANVMGATKRLAEKIVMSVQKLPSSNTKFMVVRFGNVLGSAGSVIPIFKQLIKEGKNLTVTHRDMTRYFMTIPEAAKLVVEAGLRGSGGELFVLDMGEPIKIMELAIKIIELSRAKVEIEISGLRPGEKMHEELFYSPQHVLPTQNKKILITDNECEGLLGLSTFLVDLNESVKSHSGALLMLYRQVEGFRESHVGA